MATVIANGIGRDVMDDKGDGNEDGAACDDEGVQNLINEAEMI